MTIDKIVIGTQLSTAITFPWKTVKISTLFIFFCFLVARVEGGRGVMAVKIISLIFSPVNHKVGRKQEIPKKKTPGHMQAELGLSHVAWARFKPTWSDDEQFRALKIIVLHHSAKGAALLCL